MLLLFFSIAACASLLFSNAGFQKTCEQMIYDADTRWCGNAELFIAPKQSAGADEWIDPNLLAPYAGQLMYSYNLIRCKALFVRSDTDTATATATDTSSNSTTANATTTVTSTATVADMHYFTALGTNIDEFNAYNPLTLQSGNTDNWSGDKLILGETYAEKLGLSTGDSLTLEINGQNRSFLVEGISQPKGLFLRELADGGYLLMPRETLAEIMGGDCNLIFLKTNDSASVSGFMKKLIDAFPQYAVNLGVDHAVISAETNNYVMPFWLSSILVIIMSVFIIYSSFNLIVNERISLLGILRSVGCTRRKVNRILIFESIIIGLIGGAIGCMFGIGVLHVIKSVYFSGETAAIEASVVFGAYEVVFTIAASVLLTVLSAMLPITRVTKIPIKNIILNDYRKQQMKTTKLWPLGLLLMLPCPLVPQFIGQGIVGMVLASAAATTAIIGLNLLIPPVCRLASFATRRAVHEIVLGVRNTGDFRALVNNTRLFATIISIMVFMLTLLNSMGTDLKNSYERSIKYDISAVLRQSGPEQLERLSKTEGVADFCGTYDAFPAISNYGTFLNLIAVDNTDFFNFFHAEIPPDTQMALGNLGDGRNIVTTYILRDKLKLDIGDILTLQLEDGSFDYRITGFLDTNWGIGHVGYISSDIYKADTGIEHYSNIYVKTAGDPDIVKTNIMRALSRDVLSMQTRREFEAANSDKVMGVFNSINTYALFAMLIGLLGIINNIIACFLDRLRNLALYRCIGMSRKSAGRMLMTEAVTIATIGVVTGLGTGIVMTSAVPLAVGMFWGNVTVSAPVVSIVAMCAAGVTVMLLCSLIPTIQGRNISIMDNIRYE